MNSFFFVLALSALTLANAQDESGSGDYTSLDGTNTTGLVPEDTSTPMGQIAGYVILAFAVVFLTGSYCMHKCRSTTRVHDTCLEECLGYDCCGAVEACVREHCAWKACDSDTRPTEESVV